MYMYICLCLYVHPLVAGACGCMYMYICLCLYVHPLVAGALAGACGCIGNEHMHVVLHKSAALLQPECARPRAVGKAMGKTEQSAKQWQHRGAWCKPPGGCTCTRANAHALDHSRRARLSRGSLPNFLLPYFLLPDFLTYLLPNFLTSYFLLPTP